jgi:hypothetical protein
VLIISTHLAIKRTKCKRPASGVLLFQVGDLVKVTSLANSIVKYVGLLQVIGLARSQTIVQEKPIQTINDAVDVAYYIQQKTIYKCSRHGFSRNFIR